MCSSAFAERVHFAFTGGAQSWLVPPGVVQLSITVNGGGGAGSGGGASDIFGGGASSSISIGGEFSLDSRITVAGGGGAAWRAQGGDAGFVGDGIGRTSCYGGNGGSGFGGPGGFGTGAANAGPAWGFGTGYGGGSGAPQYGGAGGGGYGGGAMNESCQSGGGGGSITTGSSASYSASGGEGGPPPGTCCTFYRGGHGARVTSIFPVQYGELVFIYVGGGGRRPNNEASGSNGWVDIDFNLPDGDLDGIPDALDNCPTIANPTQADCNSNGVGDACEIASGTPDVNQDKVPDTCQCLADLFVDRQVNGADLGALLSQWGPANASTVSDINRDGQVNGADLGYLLNAWGPCSN